VRTDVIPEIADGMATGRSVLAILNSEPELCGSAPLAVTRSAQPN